MLVHLGCAQRLQRRLALFGGLLAGGVAGATASYFASGPIAADPSYGRSIWSFLPDDLLSAVLVFAIAALVAGLAWRSFARVVPWAFLDSRPRRWLLALAAVFYGLMLVVAVAAPLVVAEPVASRPNVLLISIDTLRADHLGAYGYARDTSPRINNFAQRGVLYEQAQSSAPWTLPAHASLFSGLDPSEHGITEYASDGDTWQVLDQEIPLLAEQLRGHGYTTAAFTGGGLLGSRFGLARGFDMYRSDGRRLEDYHPAVLGWLRRNQRWPFFLFLHFYNVHRPYRPPAPYDKLFSAAEGESFAAADLEDFCAAAEQRGTPPTAAFLRQVVARYDGEIRYLDTLLGEVFDQLERSGLNDNTLVVLLSDHGEAFFEHGNCDHLKSLYQPLVRVPLIVAGPELPSGLRVPQPVQLKDVGQLILDYVGVADELGSQPRRLLAELRRQASGEPPEPALAYAETCCKGYRRDVEGWHHQPWQSGIRSIRSAGFKLITDAQGIPLELYDMQDDPGERHDLLASEDPAVSNARHQLEAAMAKRLLKIDQQRARWQSLAGRRQSLDEETLRQLRQLGYVD